MENKNEYEKNNKLIVILVIIIILILIAFGVFTYICIDRGLLFNKKVDYVSGKNDNPVDEVNENDATIKETDDSKFSNSKLQEYVDLIRPASTYDLGKIYNVDSINVSELSAKEKIEYIGHFLNNYVSFKSIDNQEYDILSEDDVKAAVEKVYGPNSYERTTFKLSCGEYTFNETDGKYYSKQGCGGTEGFTVINNVIGYEVTDDKLIITTAYVISDFTKIYKDYARSIVLDDVNIDSDTYFDDYIKNNKQNLSTIVYTFKSNDGESYNFIGFVNNK